MPFNLLLFPLVGGYWFVVRFKLLKYYHQRVERQKLIFNSIIAGTFLLLISFICTSLGVVFLPELAKKISRISPVSLPFFWTTFGAFFLGVISTEVLNIFINRERAISKAIKTIGNELELLFESVSGKPQLIQVTLTNEKVYVGWIKSLPIPNHSNYVSMAPAFSGYREKETKELVFTTQYLDVYSSYVLQGNVTDVKTLSHLVIKMDEIISANKFDIEMYERFNDMHTKEDEEEQLEENSNEVNRDTISSN